MKIAHQATEGKHKPALVLNADFTPLTTISWKRAIVLDILGSEMPDQGVRVLKYYEDDFVTTNTTKYRIPAVVVMNQYITYKKIKIPIFLKASLGN